MRPISLGVVAFSAALCSQTPAACAKCPKIPSEDRRIRWAKMSNRLYVEQGCWTIPEIVAERTDMTGFNKGPIYHFHKTKKRVTNEYTGLYYVEANLIITGGATLSIDGSGDEDIACRTLLVASNSSMYLNIRAHGGNLDIRNTRIFSWDLVNKAYDTNVEDGRSYISAITEHITGREKDTCPDYDPTASSSGRAKKDMGHANMDIFKSEIAYLGYDAPESYGVSYKARGLCKDHSNLDIFDDDNDLKYGVTGNIIMSDLHHNWFGHYSWGHDGGVWKKNRVHDNFGYGFDPHDDSDHLKIIGNEVYNNGWHGIIASKRCNNVEITNNRVYNNGRNGIMLHRQCDHATVRENSVSDNGDSGLAIFESSYLNAYDNTFTDNHMHGIRWSLGSSNGKVYNNVIEHNAEDSLFALYMFKGNDKPQVNTDRLGHPFSNEVYDNEIYTDNEIVWKMVEADDNHFYGNTFHGGEVAEFTASTNNKVEHNYFVDAEFRFVSDKDTCFAKLSEESESDDTTSEESESDDELELLEESESHDELSEESESDDTSSEELESDDTSSQELESGDKRSRKSKKEVKRPKKSKNDDMPSSESKREKTTTRSSKPEDKPGKKSRHDKPSRKSRNSEKPSKRSKKGGKKRRKDRKSKKNERSKKGKKHSTSNKKSNKIKKRDSDDSDEEQGNRQLQQPPLEQQVTPVC